MPYTKRLDRSKLDRMLIEFNLVVNIADNLCAGDLNFLITSIVHKFLKTKGLNYSNINEVIGVLDCAKMELYRQVAAPYEDKKKAENGSVSDLDKEIQ